MFYFLVETCIDLLTPLWNILQIGVSVLTKEKNDRAKTIVNINMDSIQNTATAIISMATKSNWATVKFLIA